MAINIESHIEFDGRVNSSSSDYPYGSYIDKTTGIPRTGTPIIASGINDFVGFFSSLLDEGGISPNGIPDNVNNQQYLDALKGVTRITTSGTPNYITVSGYELTLSSIDLTTDVSGTLPVANGGTGVSSLGSVDLSSFSNDMTYTDFGLTPEIIQDTSASMLTGGTHTGISVTYNDTSGIIALDVGGTVNGSLYFQSGPEGVSVSPTGISITTDGDPGEITCNDVLNIQATDLTLNGSPVGGGVGLSYADVGGMVSGNTESNILVEYDSVNDKLDFTVNAMADADDTSTEKLVKFFDDLGRTVIGFGAKGGGSGTTVMGDGANVLAGPTAVQNSVFGNGALNSNVSAPHVSVFGSQALSTLSGGSGDGVGIGYGCDVTNLSASDFVVVGSGASTAGHGVVVGGGASSSDTGCVVIGSGASSGAGSTYSTLLGTNSSSLPYNSYGISVGYSASTSSNGIAIGRSAVSTTGGICVGSSSSSEGSGVSIGQNTTNGGGGVSIGNSASTTSGSVSVGYSAESTNHGVAIGYGCTSGSFGVAIGDNITTANYETIIGGGNTNNTLLPGNVTIGEYTSGAGVTTTGAGALLQLLDSPAPNAELTDSICLHSTDVSAGNTTLSIHTEGTPVTTETPPTGDSTIVISVNGSLYKLHATAI